MRSVAMRSMRYKVPGNRVSSRVKLKHSSKQQEVTLSVKPASDWLTVKRQSLGESRDYASTPPPNPILPSSCFIFPRLLYVGGVLRVRHSVPLVNCTSTRRGRAHPANSTLRRSSPRHAVGAKTSLLCGLSGEVDARRTEELHL